MRVAYGRTSFELNANSLDSLSMRFLIRIRVDRPLKFQEGMGMIEVARSVLEDGLNSSQKKVVTVESTTTHEEVCK